MEITADAGRRAGLAMPDEAALAVERQPCFALSAASRRVLGIYRPVLEPVGLTRPERSTQ
jgi:hypothetical protein